MSSIEPSASSAEDTLTVAKSKFSSKFTELTPMFAAVTVPSDARSSDESTVILLPSAFNRFDPLNCDAPMIDVTCAFNASTSEVIFAWSTFSPVAAITFSFISFRILVICSAAADATATVDPPNASESSTALKPATSDSITFEIAQIAELSLAVAIVLPVEISF